MTFCNLGKQQSVYEMITSLGAFEGTYKKYFIRVVTKECIAKSKDHTFNMYKTIVFFKKKPKIYKETKFFVEFEKAIENGKKLIDEYKGSLGK